MKQESIDFLEANCHHWKAWEAAQIFNQLDMSVRQGFVNVIRAEFDPGYITNLWCGPCVVEVMRYVYTQYDKYLLSIKDKQE